VFSNDRPGVDIYFHSENGTKHVDPDYSVLSSDHPSVSSVPIHRSNLFCVYWFHVVLYPPPRPSPLYWWIYAT
ncbi:uncharacterized protein PV07_12729, partial [Cladophialophora immunda]